MDSYIIQGGAGLLSMSKYSNIKIMKDELYEYLLKARTLLDEKQQNLEKYLQLGIVYLSTKYFK